MKVLLHVCCAPCCAGTIFQIDGEITLFFFNPNIFPKEEYERRLKAVRKIADFYKLRLIVQDKYENEHKKWLNVVKGFEQCKEGGKRCELCYRYRIATVSYTHLTLPTKA